MGKVIVLKKLKTYHGPLNNGPLKLVLELGNLNGSERKEKYNLKKTFFEKEVGLGM